jgi:hypothetical protein
VTAWRHRVAYPAIDATFAADVDRRGPDDLTNGASDIPFAIPNMSVEICPAKAYTRIGWYRSVNAIHHGFAIGSFVDELAVSAGKDPAAFLIALLGPDRVVDLSKDGLVAPASNYGGTWTDYPIDIARARRVVDLAVQKSGWGTPLPAGRGRGIAMHRSFLTYVALVVEVDVAADGTVAVPRATVAVDAGFVAKPRSRSIADGRRRDHGDEQHAVFGDQLQGRPRRAVQLPDVSRDTNARGPARGRRASRRERGACRADRRAGVPPSVGGVMQRDLLRRRRCESGSCQSGSSSRARLAGRRIPEAPTASTIRQRSCWQLCHSEQVVIRAEPRTAESRNPCSRGTRDFLTARPRIPRLALPLARNDNPLGMTTAFELP